MPIGETHYRKGLNQSGASRAAETRSNGHIGKVVNYHGFTGTKDKAGPCGCERHQNQVMELYERHSVDVDILMESKIQRLHSVPCFMYAQGIIDKGFEKNDRVFIQYINGDMTMPVATAYYREPEGLEIFWNNLKYSVGKFVTELLPGIGD